MKNGDDGDNIDADSGDDEMDTALKRIVSRGGGSDVDCDDDDVGWIMARYDTAVRWIMPCDNGIARWIMPCDNGIAR
jgi:hypothetical protein